MYIIKCVIYVTNSKIGLEDLEKNTIKLQEENKDDRAEELNKTTKDSHNNTM